jgi:Leucine-rich repeat (LRR) protein
MCSTAGWASLEYISAADNLFTGPVPVIWPRTLHHVDLSGNDFNDTIPTQMCNCPELEYLLLSGNQFEGGSIPSCVANLDKLRVLELSDAQLSGEIPTQLDQLRDLNVLDISNNRLTGTLPSVLGRLLKMVHLHLNDNDFRGSIPSQLGSLSLIQELYLDGNVLTGTVPSSFANLGELQNFTLSENEVSGSVPVGMCSFESLNLTYIDVGCNLVCDCCGSAEACA